MELSKGVVVMKVKRLVISVILGALLGVVCIIGAQVRSGFTNGPVFLFALFYNRIVMGVFFGLLERPQTLKTALIRGATIGLVVSFAFFATTGFDDVMSFVAGIVYGLIIEAVLFNMKENKAA
jgi:hypothetical protein